jgi:hypothetical protein
VGTGVGAGVGLGHADAVQVCDSVSGDGHAVPPLDGGV